MKVTCQTRQTKNVKQDIKTKPIKFNCTFTESDHVIQSGRFDHQELYTLECLLNSPCSRSKASFQWETFKFHVLTLSYLPKVMNVCRVLSR